MNRLNVKAFALAGGVLWSSAILLLGLGAWLFNWGAPLVRGAGSLYLGYAPTLVGSIIGAAWAFVDGLIACGLLAWLYNRFAGK